MDRDSIYVVLHREYFNRFPDEMFAEGDGGGLAAAGHQGLTAGVARDVAHDVGAQRLRALAGQRQARRPIATGAVHLCCQLAACSVTAWS